MTQTNAQIKEQLRLPGQAAAPGGPVDLTGMFGMHWAFRRDLDRFVAAVAATPVGDRATWQALQRRWELFRRVLHDHHTGEDAGLWPALAAKADAAGRATLAAMEEEHHGIDPLLVAVAEGLARMAAAADADARAALEVRVVAARERLGAHLAHEERDALELVQALLSPAEWHHIERKYFQQSKSPRQLAEVVGWALHDLPPGALDRMLTPANPFRVAWQLFLRRPFARRERVAFRYAS
ncbi:hemerythrin domain-containing protein [Dactylosporangium sp. NPDC005572]|uniref:hemerythrin domain-containing protein n=1 Tax=Dactylosporangium sp. NPDC005572 TaxID=3156889 RepID=UPI0033BEB6DA